MFNLFLVDALEKEVADVVFRKLYGIAVSIPEPKVGEQVLFSKMRNELLEHTIKEI